MLFIVFVNGLFSFILIRVVVQLWSGLLVWFSKWLSNFSLSLCIPRPSLAVLCGLVKSQNIEEVAGRAEDGQSIKLVVSTTSPFLGLTILYDVLLSKLTLNNYFCSNLTLAFGPGRYSCVALWRVTLRLHQNRQDFFLISYPLNCKLRKLCMPILLNVLISAVITY